MRTVNAGRKQCLVLLVDDSAESYELYSEILASAGFAVAGADSGEDAYRRAVQLAPDLIIMDFELRGADGAMATRLLKDDVRTRAIPIVMLTGHATRHHWERARSAGCDAFLAKPCSYHRLIDEVRRLLGGRKEARHGGTVLVIEDDLDVRDVIAELLAAEGFIAVGASDGREGIEWLRSATVPPRVILLDLMMPVMDGWTFRAAQLADPQLASIPVVVLSAASELGATALQLKVDDYLQKPLDVPRLLTAIERHI
jgi:CheY-like chemotaxis protein